MACVWVRCGSDCACGLRGPQGAYLACHSTRSHILAGRCLPCMPQHALTHPRRMTRAQDTAHRGAYPGGTVFCCSGSLSASRSALARVLSLRQFLSAPCKTLWPIQRKARTLGAFASESIAAAERRWLRVPQHTCCCSMRVSLVQTVTTDRMKVALVGRSSEVAALRSTGRCCVRSCPTFPLAEGQRLA